MYSFLSIINEIRFISAARLSVGLINHLGRSPLFGSLAVVYQLNGISKHCRAHTFLANIDFFLILFGEVVKYIGVPVTK